MPEVRSAITGFEALRTRTPAASLGATWMTFVVALALALPQPPDPFKVAIGSVAGAALVFLGFAAASRCRGIQPHPPRQRARLSGLALLGGVAIGIVLLGVLVLLARKEPALGARFADRLTEPVWRPWALAFESSVLEEVTFRLFAMSAIAWVLSRVTARPAVPLIVSLAASAAIFGLAHLPAWLALVQPTFVLVAAVILLNGACGLLFGWVFWRWGLPYAILCHLAGDVVVQGLGPRLLA